MSYRVKKSFCPVCKNALDAVTDFEGHDQLPQEGDVSFCMYCFELLQFRKDLTLEKLDIDELDTDERNDILCSLEELRRQMKATLQ